MGFIALQSYPQGDKYESSPIEEEIDDICDLITAIRNIRAEKGIAPSEKITVFLEPFSENFEKMVKENISEIKMLAKVEELSFEIGDLKDEGFASSVCKMAKVFVLIRKDENHHQKERERLSLELAKLQKDRVKFLNKLNNPSFAERAPEEVIKRHKEILAEIELKSGEIEKLLKEMTT